MMNIRSCIPVHVYSTDFYPGYLVPEHVCNTFASENNDYAPCVAELGMNV